MRLLLLFLFSVVTAFAGNFTFNYGTYGSGTGTTNVTWSRNTSSNVVTFSAISTTSGTAGSGVQLTVTDSQNVVALNAWVINATHAGTTYTNSFYANPAKVYSVTYHSDWGAGSANPVAMIATSSGPLVAAPSIVELKVKGSGSSVISGGSGSYVLSHDNDVQHCLIGLSGNVLSVSGSSVGSDAVRILDASDNSNHVDISIHVGSYRITYNIPPNDGEFQIVYKIIQDGVEYANIATMKGYPGGPLQADLPNDHDAQLISYMLGVVKAPNGVYIKDDTGQVDLPVQHGVPSSVNQTGGTGTSSNASKPAVPSGSSTTTSGTPVWDNSGTSSGAGLTNAVYQQGAAKMIDSINANTDALKSLNGSGSGSGSNSDDGTHTRLDTANSLLTGVKATTDKLDTVATRQNKDTPDVDTASSAWRSGGAASSFQAGAQGSFDLISGSSWGSVTSLVPPAMSSIDPLTVQSVDNFSFGEIVTPLGTWKMQPFVALPWLKNSLNCIRELFLWGLGIMFYVEAQAKLERMQFALSLVPQIDTVQEQASVLGNQVPGVSSAISLAKRLISAPIIIGTIHIQIAAAIVAMNSALGGLIAGWSFDGMMHPIQHIASQGGSFFYVALALIDASYPIYASIEFGVAWILFSWACMVTYGVASAAIKVEKI